MKSVSSALREWFVIAFGDVMKLIRDGKRTGQQLEPLRVAIQAVINGDSFEVKLLSRPPIEQLLYKGKWDSWESHPEGIIIQRRGQLILVTSI